jgi:hypothetical protein
MKLGKLLQPRVPCLPRQRRHPRPQEPLTPYHCQHLRESGVTVGGEGGTEGGKVGPLLYVTHQLCSLICLIWYR